jgi:hypothetical protein
MAHHCHAEGCNVEVPPKLLMCRKHWFMVPKNLQARIWATYRPGQEIDKNPSPEYREAQRAAIDAVKAKQRTTTQEPDWKGIAYRLLLGLQAWAQDEDGVHPDAWDSFKEGMDAVGEPCFYDTEGEEWRYKSLPSHVCDCCGKNPCCCDPATDYHIISNPGAF